MPQIQQWLEKLGMSEYAQRFAENRIDFSVLRDLTDQDLKDLGVVLGDRRKMLRAIGELDNATTAAPGVSTEATPQEAAERRQLTVMFCDLVGSTAMSARLDPEDMRGIIGAYHKCCATLIVSNGGFVAKYMGDGVLSYFGYPQAHEDDAESAVQAALAIVDAAPKLETAASASLHVRVGIATGIVVVGDLLGAGEAQERGIVGDTPNLAARLQSIAEPDSVVMAEGTRRLLGNLFELADLGARDLKGIAEPVRAWAALRANPSESRFEALHATGLTALVGREEESELLLRRWSKAKAGEGQVVLLSGEAGIGKSRLTAAFLDRLADEPHTRLRYFCSPQRTDSALHPIISQMERAARLTRNDTLGAKLDKLDALLEQGATSREEAALLAEMLSLPNDGRYPTLELVPQQRRQKTFEALISQTEALARQKPVLMIFEDAHWADPSSLEAFGRLVDRIKTLRVLLIVTLRPEFEPPWIGRPHVTALTLNRLAERDVDAMIDRVVGNNQLPVHIRQDIVERADGIPLFVEEMTRAVLEAEGEGAAIRTIAAVPSPALSVPASLHASLMARLDRLGSAKEVAQIGAAIGREFSHALLASVVRRPEAELGSALDSLIVAGLLFRQGAPPYATYLFKHALVQDAAYGTLLREPRRALHARIAEAIESQFADIVGSHPELLARHCTEAGLIEKAAALWGKAGLRSLARSALIEAEAQFTRALAQIAGLPSTPTLRREEIKFQNGLSSALMQSRGYAAPETRKSLDQARLLIEQVQARGEPLEDPMSLFSILYGFWLMNLSAFDGDVAREVASQILAFAQKQKDTFPLVIGHRAMGGSLLIAGNIMEGRSHHDRAIALYDPPVHRPFVLRYGADARVSTLSTRQLALWLLGYPQAARADVDYALKDAREIGHALTICYALIFGSMLDTHCGDYAAAKARAEEAITLGDEKGAAFWKAAGIMSVGRIFAHTGQALNAVRTLGASISAFRSVGARAWLPTSLTNLAEAHADLGQFDDAWRCIDEAMTLMKAHGERWCEADIHRTAGEIALMSPQRDTEKAQAYFERALEIARAQQARSWELRAAMSMARLWRDQGKRRQARELLAPIYDWFTEGFDTLDLKQAKTLLDELAL